MKSSKPKRLSTLPAILLISGIGVPLWLTVGRLLLGSGIWEMVCGVVICQPQGKLQIPLMLSLVIPIVLALVIKFRRASLSAKRLGIWRAVMSAYLISYLVYGLFFVDSGDGADTYNNVFVHGAFRADPFFILSGTICQIAVLFAVVFAIISGAIIFTAPKRTKR